MARRGRRSSAALKARARKRDMKLVEVAFERLDAERERDVRISDHNSMRGVGVVTAGRAAPTRARVPLVPYQRNTVMPLSPPASFSEESADSYVADRVRERKAARLTRSFEEGMRDEDPDAFLSVPK